MGPLACRAALDTKPLRSVTIWDGIVVAGLPTPYRLGRIAVVCINFETWRWSALSRSADMHAPIPPDFEAVYCYIIQLSALDDDLIQ